MSTNVQNMQNFQRYIKCGEILKPPIESYQRPYVVKCFNCNEIYLLFEAFIFHIEDHCSSAFDKIEPDPSAEIPDKTQNITTDEERMHVGEQVDETNVNIKVEDNCVIQTLDPLITVKPEHLSDDECSSVKEEFKSSVDDQTKNNALKVKDKEENLAAFEDICESDNSIENIDKTETYSYNSSDEELENSSDVSVFIDEDDDYENLKKPRSVQKCSKTQSAFISEFLKSKNNVNAFIACYKNQPSLWNKNYPFLRQKQKRQNILQQIAQELNEQHGMEITWNQAASIIIHLCRKYREDLKGINNEEGDKKYKPSWFFEDLNFLKPFIENNPIAKIDSHIPDLLPNQIIQILEIYKEFPHLWNTDLIEHYCKNKTYAAKQEMLQLLDTKMGLKLTESILEDYFRTINNCFSRAKRFRTDSKMKNKNIDSSAEGKKQEDYYEHMIFLYDHVGAFECSECRRSFKNPLHLKIHKNHDHELEPLTCSLCKKEFKTAGSYKSHAKRHMEDLNYVCKECGKKFLHSNELRIHMRNHTGAKPFCCEICGASFRHIQGFSNHHRRHIKNYLHTCAICSKGFYTKDRYKDHMNAHSNIRSQICNVCGKAFITKKSLQQHVVVHDDARKHACKLCGKTFKHKTGVNQHMRTHGIANSEDKSAAKKE